jgi:uncharacterized protein (TIGR04255 family)
MQPICHIGRKVEEGHLRYKKAPILEAVLEFRWSPPKQQDQLSALLTATAFAGLVEPKPRFRIDAAINVDANEFLHQQRQVGFEVARGDRSEIVFLEEQKFVFVKPAPYDRWETFSARALELLDATVSALGISEFERVGTRFINRIDIPEASINTDDYVTVSFDGPREDRGMVEEFQMRVVKPSATEGIRYALVLATTASPLSDHTAVLLDIDVFTQGPLSATGEELMRTLGAMRDEKNDIFEKCLTQKSRDLFGDVEQ